MKKLFLLFIVLFECFFVNVAAGNDVGCEVRGRRVDSRTYCAFGENTIIKDLETKLSNERNEIKIVIDGYNAENLEYLPIDIVDAFPKVLEIRIEHTSLKRLSKKNFHGLDELRKLYLHSNKLSEIDEDAFDDLSSIQHISLNYNHLKSLPAKVFSKIPSVADLSLGFNQLTTLDPDLLKNNRGLNLFHLPKNQFTTFPPGFFCTGTSLTTLNLDFNNISTIDPEWFRNCSRLSFINLGDNQITEISSDIFKHTPSIKDIYMSKNPLRTIDFAAFENTNVELVVLKGVTISRVLNIDAIDKVKKGYIMQFSPYSCTGETLFGDNEAFKQRVKERCILT